MADDDKMTEREIKDAMRALLARVADALGKDVPYDPERDLRRALKLAEKLKDVDE